jgi:hypothetical protein
MVPGLVVRGASVAFDESAGNHGACVDEWCRRCAQHGQVSLEERRARGLFSLTGATPLRQTDVEPPGAGPSVRPQVVCRQTKSGDALHCGKSLHRQYSPFGLMLLRTIGVRLCIYSVRAFATVRWHSYSIG